ncbi:hypothetical protein [Glycomyces algeriensis]|uniref:Glycosyl hydrolase family 39 n=1 Tax=Glycomyces algeriensis TaxID=256037 RepID=A0A9W6LGW6_9ACTN|nr:hypothetical protein [Glycomyces algeriensis]MDA1364295.1 hypothetical protein [Glycomyces algeriensis]MDR7350326.1 hypothetical protein [Glycomyces algeriensis]GLI43033.1 hypothetical protein GALLR39Z86_28830 [Glycomyces algeriensis]
MDATPSAPPARVIADFTETINPHASPDLFGLSNEPSKDHAAQVYPLLQAAGIRFQRGTLHVNRLFDEPFPGATLEDWRANTGGIRESGNWDWRPLGWLDHARRHGIRTQLNLLQIPNWLSHNGTASGIPADWEAWRHVVGTVIERFGDRIDSVDVLNEPMTPVMIDLEGTAYTSQEAAAADLYVHTAHAVREANPDLIVGGPGEDRRGGEFGSLGTILRDPRVTPADLRFVSYHAYDPYPGRRLELAALDELLESTGRQRLPVYLNEWNHDYFGDTTAPEVKGERAVAFAARTLIDLANEPRLAGAAFMSALPGNVPLDPDQNAPGLVIAQAVYDWHGDHAVLWPQSRAFALFSVAMGLGAGPFRTCAVTAPDPLAALAFVNTDGREGVVVVNDGPEPSSCRVELPGVTATTGDLCNALPGAPGLDCTRIDLAPTPDGAAALLSLAPYSAAGLLCP